MSKSQDEGFKNTLRRMLNTPAKPIKELPKKRPAKPAQAKKTRDADRD